MSMKPFGFKRGAARRRLTALSVVLVLLLASMALLAHAAPKKPQSLSEDEQFYRFIEVAGEVYKDIRSDFVDEVPPQKILEGAIRGMFLVLDEHSSYLDPDSLSQLEKDTEGEFSGIGIHITLRQGILTVIAPIPGSPSARLGIRPWDRIIEIEGQTTEGISLQDAVRKLTGPPGTQVSIKIFRQGESEPIPYTVTRQVIKIDCVHWQMFDDGIGYIRLAKFSDSTSPDMKKAIAELKEKGMRGLILDLRFNSGGLLREAIEVSEFFVPKGEVIVSTKGRKKGQDREYMSKTPPIVEVPVFVLVNEGTASASEIVAGAIQDLRLGVVMGPEIDGKALNTFGKGSVQTIEELKHSIAVDDQGNEMANAIRLTTARYYTPSGRSIHGKGIKPDVSIPVPADFEVGLLRHGMIGDPSTIEPGTEVPKDDQATTQPSPTQESEPTEEPEPAATPEETPKAEQGAPTPTPDPDFYKKLLPKPKKTKTEKKDTFQDVMLDQARRELKVYLILRQASRNAAIPALESASSGATHKTGALGITTEKGKDEKK